MKRIAIILGTRPEAIKLLPVYLAARKMDELDPLLISTGQHHELVYDALDLFKCKLDVDLNVMQPNQSLASLTSRIFKGLDQTLDDDVDAVVVQGDTTSTMVGAMLAFYKGLPCAHVEAGLRSNDMLSPFPEEYNRRIVSLSARWHFAPTDVAAENLRRENIQENVFVVGNTSIDAAYMIAGAQTLPSQRLLNVCPVLQSSSRRIILVTAHRRENFGDPLRQIIAAVAAIATANPDIDIIWPVHPNPNVHDVVHAHLPKLSNIFLIDPVRYDDLIYLMKRSHIVLTDSGGIQEEAPAFNKPVVVLRNTTERPEGIDSGCSVLAGPNKQSILRHVNELLLDADVHARMSQAGTPYGDGKASQRIVEVIASGLA